MLKTTTETELTEAFQLAKPQLIKALLYSLFIAVLMLTPSIYMLEVYERVINSRNIHTLAMITLAAIGIYIWISALVWRRQTALITAGQIFEVTVLPRVIDATIRQKLAQSSTNVLLALQDLKSVKEQFHSQVIVAVMELPISLFYLAIIFSLNPLLGWLTIIAALIQAGIALLNERYTKKHIHAANLHSLESIKQSQNNLENAETAIPMGMVDNIVKKWQRQHEKFLAHQMAGSNYSAIFQSLSKFWQTTTASAILGLACYVLLHDALNGGAAWMIVASILGGKILAPYALIVSRWQSIGNAIVAWQRLNSLLSTFKKNDVSLRLEPPQGHLTVEPLLVTAPTDPSAVILRDIKFSLQPGESMAIIGPSASGKTSLTKVLAGLWPSQAGKVRLDGADILQWSKDELSPYLGYLPQHVDIPEGTIEEIIGRHSTSEFKAVSEAATAAGLAEWIAGLPDQYKTFIGENGLIASGGQIQRLGLARAIFGTPRFVILDEPNANLDEAGDQALIAALAILKKNGTTTVIATHRVSVLSQVDYILVMQNGTQIAFGPKETILQALSAKSNALTKRGATQAT